ncbi:MAG: putative anti-sigma regulatory factor, serine/threonine protein kinase [Streptosporangiaceae bacterium]|nr:putative anti-sigma regulatory factor, serine/threonine protein kinase [Streptosporangiaceae bacterium]
MGIIMATTGKARLEVNLPPIPQAVGIARIFVRHQLISLRYADLIEDACVIASELMTNAVNATASDDPRTRGRIRMYLGPHEGRPVLEVWDSCPWMPVFREPDFVAESGRGLHIVRSLAADLGWRRDVDRGGKTVWALLGPAALLRDSGSSDDHGGEDIISP